MKEITYDDIIKTISEIIENDNIYKKGLTLTYTVSDKHHFKLNETLYYKKNPNGDKFTNSDVIELELDGLTIKIIKN